MRFEDQFEDHVKFADEINRVIHRRKEIMLALCSEMETQEKAVVVAVENHQKYLRFRHGVHLHNFNSRIVEAAFNKVVDIANSDQEKSVPLLDCFEDDMKTVI